MTTGIYKITNKQNGKVYIGQSVDIERRWQEHRKRYNIEKYDTLFYKAIRKYGLENFSFEIIEVCTKEELDDKEIYWIKHYNSFDAEYGYNLTIGGYSPHFMRLSSDKLKDIIDLLQNSDILLMDIAKKYEVSLNTIRDINQGYTWHNENLDYPLRKNNYKKYYCKDCGREITKKALRCVECAQKEKRVTERPDKNNLYNLLIQENGNFTKVSKMFNVTDNTVRKWCKAYNLPFHSKDYK